MASPVEPPFVPGGNLEEIAPPPAARMPEKDDPPREPLRWRWSRFSTAEYFVSGAAGAVTLGAAVVTPRRQHSLNGGILFDDAVRDALRPASLETRYEFRDASDVGVSLLVSWPLLVDSLATAWWHRGSRDAAEQMALIDLETLAISGAVQGMTNVLVSRERPYGPDCGSQLPGDALDCVRSFRYRSFFSGHTAFGFTGAALICMHHFQAELLGAPWDALSCAGGYAVATATSTFRVVSDVHYATDVVAGMLTGTLIGYGVPLLHYAFPQTNAEDARLMLRIVPVAGGVGVLGVF